MRLLIFNVVTLFLLSCSLHSTAGAQWVEIPNAPTDRVTCVAVHNSNIYVATIDTTYTPTGVSVSTDEGKTWTSGALPGIGVDCFTFSASKVFAGASYSVALNDSTTEGIFVSTDNGVTRARSDSGMTSWDVSSMTVGGGNIYAGMGNESSGIYKSTDDGVSWSHVWRENATVSSMATIGGDLFAGGDGNVQPFPLFLYLSTNGGVSWEERDNGMSGYIPSLAVSGNELWAASGYNRISRSTDNGSTWIWADSGTVRVNASNISGAFLAAAAGCVVASTDEGVYVTADDGAHWKDITAGLPLGLHDSYTFFVAMDDTTIYAGDGSSGGIWKRSLAEAVTGVKKQPDLIPSKFSLAQNYPNPFNPTTTLRYELPRESFVRLSVFNILGQEVRTLVNETQQAGYRSVSFNAGNLPSGMYFYRLTAGSFNDVKKMVLLK
jgi:hypothetical protein